MDMSKIHLCIDSIHDDPYYAWCTSGDDDTPHKLACNGQFAQLDAATIVIADFLGDCPLVDQGTDECQKGIRCQECYDALDPLEILKHMEL